MRKVLSALLLFSLAAALPGASFADKRGPSGSAAGGAGFSFPAKGNSELAAAAFENGTYNDELRADDIKLFTSKTALRFQPDLAAEAFHRAYSTLDGAAKVAFSQKHGEQIFMVIQSLGIASREGRITQEEYEDLNSKILGLGFHTMDGQFPGAGKKADGPANGGQAMVNAVVTATSRIYTKDGTPAEKAEDERKVDKIASDYKDTSWVQSAAADSYNKLGNHRRAEQTANAAIALDSNNPEAYKARALARASLEDRKGAIEDIRKAAAIDPQDESAKLLATLLESRKDNPSLKSISSVDEIRRALGASDDGAEAVRGGQAAAGGLGGGSGEDAESLAAPDFARSKAYLKTALAKNRLGDYESAAHYASLAIERDPGNREAYLERANAYNFLGRYDEAVRDTTHVIEKDPANLQAFNMRAWALNRNGRAQDAATDATRAIDLNPNFADAWFNRALAYEKQGDYKRMLDDFKRAAALSGAYSGRYQDAVAQYGPRVPGYASLAPAPGAAGAAGTAGKSSSPLRKFLTLLFFTLTGGALVAMGLIHILGGRGQAAEAGRITHPDVLSPSVFYEGVATGKYKIERKLGEGGMGVVYEATDQSLGRKVAIKKMNEEIKVNEREKQRFLDEARTVALLKHPGIVEIYTIFEEDANIYLVFEHVDGVTLDHTIDKEARLPFEKARRVIGETAAALAYAHSKNVVHRDLKLSNIMLSSEGQVKVMDFGLARRAMESRARSSNAEVVGSPAYMAPEQELGASSVESDIYSLGVCLYEALSGVLPFQGPDFHAQKTRLTYQRLSDMLPGLPKGVDGIMERCLAPEPENRFRSADDFRRALDELA